MNTVELVLSVLALTVVVGLIAVFVWMRRRSRREIVRTITALVRATVWRKGIRFEVMRQEAGAYVWIMYRGKRSVCQVRYAPKEPVPLTYSNRRGRHERLSVRKLMQGGDSLRKLLNRA